MARMQYGEFHHERPRKWAELPEEVAIPFIEEQLRIAEECRREMAAGRICKCWHHLDDHNDFGNGKISCDLHDCECENFRPRVESDGLERL